MPGYELINNFEKNAVNEIFDNKELFYNGKRVKKFEKEFARYIGAKYAVAVSSGTAAIKIALKCLGIKTGDEVITQSFTFIATIEAIVDVGATPIVINVDDSLNMDVKELEKHITKNTKAIIPVHMLGVAAEMSKINKIAKKFKIPVVDDNCEALGAKWGKDKLGIQSDICTWSFDNGKTITTGEGGMITTNNKNLSMLFREYRDHGHQNNPKYPRGRDTHRIYGFNFRTTEINAAIGIEQLKKLNFIVKENKKRYNIYKKELLKIKHIKLRRIPKANIPLCDCIIFSIDDLKKIKKILTELSKKNIITKNVPDAIEWHFAKYWDHIFKEQKISKQQLETKFLKSSYYLERSIAIPIFVKEPLKQTIKKAKELSQIIKSFV